MLLSRTIGFLCLIGLMCALTEAAQKPTKSKDSNYWLDKVKEWGTAVRQHNPGDPDPAAVGIGSWRTRNLETVVALVIKLASPLESTEHALPEVQIQRALGLTDKEVRQGGLNRLLKQGALLHTDIAMLGLDRGTYQDARERIGVFDDGHVTILLKTLHWKLARQLIDSSSSLPSQDPMVRQWYIATTAYMQSRRLLAYAGQNLEGALKIFPSDDKILFYAGVLHETWASPYIQNTPPPLGVGFTYGSKKSELKQARQFFLKAVAANPGNAEAHLRLGRVLGLLGYHGQAVAELKQATAAITDPQLLYYTSLYLGCEFEILSSRDEARGQYENAAMLYPSAQSPLLALSRLARSSNDAEGAFLAIQRVFALQQKDSRKDDPLWEYDLAHVRNAAELVAEMHKAFRESRDSINTAAGQ